MLFRLSFYRWALILGLLGFGRLSWSQVELHFDAILPKGGPEKQSDEASGGTNDASIMNQNDSGNSQIGDHQSEAPGVAPPLRLQTDPTLGAPHFFTLIPESSQVFRNSPITLPFVQEIAGGWTLEGLGSGHSQYVFEGVPLNNPWNPHRELVNSHFSAFVFEPSSPSEYSFSPGVNLGPKQSTKPRGASASLTRGFDYFAQAGFFDYLAGGFRYHSPEKQFSIFAVEDSRNSQADRAQAGNSEADSQLGINLLYQQKFPDFKSELGLLYLEDRRELDYAGGPGGDDLNYTAGTNRFILYFKRGVSQVSYRYFSDQSKNLPDAVHPDELTTRFQSHSIPFQFALYSLATEQTTDLSFLVIGNAEHGNATESYNGAVSSYDNKSFYSIQPELRAKWLRTDLEFHAALSWLLTFQNRKWESESQRGSPQLLFSLTRKRSSVRLSEYSLQRSFRSPGLYELFSSYGNSKIKSEESWALKWNENFKAGQFRFQLGAYYRELRDSIDYDIPSNRYVNSSFARFFGTSLRLSTPLSEKIDFSWKANVAQAVDRQAIPLLRRAPWDLALALNSKWLGGNFEVSEKIVGPRWDLNPQNFQRLRLPPFAVTSLAFTKALRRIDPEKVEWFCQIENLFNSKHQEIAGYESRRFHFSLGLRGEFN